MITTNANTSSLKEIRERERKEKDDIIKSKCEELAIERAGGTDKLVALSNKYKGLWYLPVIADDDSIEKMLVLKPIDRHILSYASTKITDDGLYMFLETAMNECIIKDLSDMVIMEEDDYFIPAANSFNKILEGKKTNLLKR